MGEILEISQGDAQQNALNGWGDTMGKIQYWCPEDGNTIIQSVSHTNGEQTSRNILNPKDGNVKYREETCNSLLTVQNFNKLVFIMNHACVTTRS